MTVTCSQEHLFNELSKLLSPLVKDDISSSLDTSSIVLTERFKDCLQSLIDHYEGTLQLDVNLTAAPILTTLTNKTDSESDNNDIDENENGNLEKYIQILDKAQRKFRSVKRSLDSPSSTITTSDEKLRWNEILQITKKLGRRLLDMERRRNQNKSDATHLSKTSASQKTSCITTSTHGRNEHKSNQGNFPSSVSVYAERLRKQQKDIYKNPPVLPPPICTIYDGTVGLPKRDKTTKRFTFAPHPSSQKQKDIMLLFQSFQPNQSPAEVLQGGSFGGTYYRPIVSAVTNESYSNVQKVLDTSVDPEWINGLDVATHVTSSVYRANVNKYKVKCGGSLGMWESSGWISNIDPYGWFQWYCRFFQGRRSSDDCRQIKRWLALAGPKGRFKSQLCNKILAACHKGSALNNTTISPVVRQTLFHWGLLVTRDVLEEHIKLKK